MLILITITGFSINQRTHEVKLFAQNEEYRKRCYNLRNSTSDARDIEYTFNTEQKRIFNYLTDYLKSQKSTQGAKTYGEALTAIVGTTIESPDLRFCTYRYKNQEDDIIPIDKKTKKYIDELIKAHQNK